MATFRPKSQALSRFVRHKDGWLFPCTTDGEIRDGFMRVRIEKTDLKPIAHEITVANMGIDYKDMQYMTVFAPASDVLKPVRVVSVWLRHSYAKNWRYGLRCPLPFAKIDRDKLLWIRPVELSGDRAFAFDRFYWGSNRCRRTDG